MPGEYPSSLISHPSCRTGITLLEILISIGVLSVGVLGAASLLPMANYFQNETLKYDRGGALAQQAVHDLQIKNYLSPRRWIFVDPNSPAGGAVGIMGLTANTGFSAFVIDPLGFAYAAQQTSAVTFPCYFPAFPNNGATPPGIPVFRAGITANDYWPTAATMPVAVPIPMTFSVADRMMRSSDDVLFEYDRASLLAENPENYDLRPTAITNANPNGNPTLNLPTANAPNFAGDFSWIATVSRVPSDMVTGVVSANLHRFQVSVVVLQKRDPTLWAGAGGITLEQPPSERQVYAMFTQYGGQSLATLTTPAPFYGGGGLQLYVYEASASPAAGVPSRHWLDNIKPNTYLMMSANFQAYLTAGFTGASTPYPQLAWYRILNVDDGPNSDPSFSGPGTRWYRNVTVAGSDWPSMSFQWPQPSAAVPSPPLYPYWNGVDPSAPNGMMPLAKGTGGASTPVVFCTLMDDAVAEYDDVVTLDESLVHE